MSTQAVAFAPPLSTPPVVGGRSVPIFVKRRLHNRPNARETETRTSGIVRARICLGDVMRLVMTDEPHGVTGSHAPSRRKGVAHCVPKKSGPSLVVEEPESLAT